MLKQSYLPTLCLIVLLPVSAAAQMAAEITVGEDTAQLEEGRLAPEQIALLPAMDLRRWPDDGFFETHISLVDALSSAHADEHGAVMLDLAELYLGQMLTPEAQSFVEAAGQTAWGDSPRYAALHDAVRLLRGTPLDDVTRSILTEDARHDRGLWLSLNAIASGDPEMLGDTLQGALIGLSYQSGPVARGLLPLITEAAVRLQDIPVSETALALLSTVPELANSPSGHYLRGRHQENLDNEKSALEAYFEASQGWDRYAARARIALADLAIADGSSGALLAARDVLSAGSGAWRGDGLEIAVLERQAQVNGMLGDDVAALLAYRRIITRFPQSAEADMAIEAAAGHLDAVYRDGSEGRIELADWFELHQILLPTYRYLPSFPGFNEVLADAVYDMGSTYLAMSEYRQTLSIFEQWPLSLGRAAPAEDVNRVTYKLARAQVRAGLWDDAIASLDMISPTMSPDFRDAVNKLRVAALTELGDGDTLLRTFVAEPDADSLRSWARALFVKQDWAGAKNQYARLFDEFPEAFRIGDASYLLIAAHRDGDAAMGRRVASAFPELTQSEGIAGLATSLLAQPEPLMPLRTDMTSDRLDSARDLMQLIENSGL